jgi:long-chain acyl-CoA synthetase
MCDMHITQGLKRAAQVKPRGVSTVFRGRRRTWRETEERVARLAGGLQRLGLSRGARAAILALNSDRYFEYLFAVPWAGGVTVPLNIRLAAPEIAYILEDSGTEILFVDEHYAGLLEPLEGKMATVREVVFLGEDGAPAGARTYEDLLEAGAAPDVMCGGDDLAGIFYTGGTTGKAKGVMLSHQNLVANAANAIAGIGYDVDSVYLHAAPMFHLADGSSTLAVTMVGGTHVFVPKFDPADCLAAIQRERVTHAVFVPTMINMLVNFPRVGAHDVSALETIMFGGSPMPEAVLRRALEAIPGCRFVHGYGMTEVAPIATLLDPRYATLEGPYAGRLKSCGRAAVLCEVKIVDEQDREVPRRTVGEVLVRGPNVMLGYWNQPEATAQALRGGWMHTGDRGYMDEEGFVYIVDRLKDMVITGGENVYSIEVESAISTLDGVAEVAVIGIPDDTWGERVHAIVVPRPGRTLTPEQVIAHCRTQIAGYKCPRSVEIRSAPLPLSGAGKILKTALREPFWRGREKRVN